MSDPSNLRTYITHLGLKPEVADIYIALHTYGTQTLSELARNSGVQRIAIYRMLDELKASGLIEFEPRYKKLLLSAAPIDNITNLLAQRADELSKLQHQFADIATAFTNSGTRSETRVRFYEGMQGLRQMVWNQTKDKGENLSILYDSMQHKHEQNFSFFERWVHTCNLRGIRFRGIVGEHFIASQQKWYAGHHNERLKHWDSRYISEAAFRIPYSMVVYGDVVLYYNWNDERITGIEIHNPAIAAMQRQFFEMLWQQAEPVNDTVGPTLQSNLDRA